jgi:hypothetical protein
MYKRIIFLISLILATALYAEKIDNTTGLIIDEGLGKVKENCTICHTGRFIVVNGGDKAFWTKKIHIMQVAYGLWKIEKEDKEILIKYLSKNYSKKKAVSIDK